MLDTIPPLARTILLVSFGLPAILSVMFFGLLAFYERIGTTKDEMIEVEG